MADDRQQSAARMPSWWLRMADDRELANLRLEYQEACREKDEFRMWAIQVRRRKRLSELGVASSYHD